MAAAFFIDNPYSIGRPGRAKRGAMFEGRRELEKALAVAEAGKVVEGAYRLAMTQPALTRAIARLEIRFGAPLFEQLPTGVRPTAQGAEAAQQARRLLRAFGRQRCPASLVLRRSAESLAPVRGLRVLIRDAARRGRGCTVTRQIIPATANGPAAPRRFVVGATGRRSG